MRHNRTRITLSVLILVCLSLIPQGCSPEAGQPADTRTVPHSEQRGIYALDIESGDIRLIYASSDEIFTSTLRLSNSGDRLVFAAKKGGPEDSRMEIFSIDTAGGEPRQITDNDFFDLYPAWSSDDSRIAFLSWR